MCVALTTNYVELVPLAVETFHRVKMWLKMSRAEVAADAALE